MRRYSYSDFFQTFPEIYRNFSQVVDHATNFRAEVEDKRILHGAKSVLSIGAGEAQLELGLCRDLGASMTIVEPEATYVQKIRSEAKLLKTPDLITEIFEGTFQNYAPSRLFDRIFAIHSWYAIGKDKMQLQRALDFLELNGQLFITLVSADNPIQKIAKFTSNESGAGLTAEELSDWAKSCGFQHKYWDNKRSIKCSLLQNDEGLTSAGKALVSFPAFTPWHEMTQAEQIRVQEILSSARNGDSIILKNGCLLIQK